MKKLTVVELLTGLVRCEVSGSLCSEDFFFDADVADDADDADLLNLLLRAD